MSESQPQLCGEKEVGAAHGGLVGFGRECIGLVILDEHCKKTVEVRKPENLRPCLRAPFPQYGCCYWIAWPGTKELTEKVSQGHGKHKSQDYLTRSEPRSKMRFMIRIDWLASRKTASR